MPTKEVNWNDITIRKYKYLENALTLENEVEKVVKVLSVITGKDEDHFYDMTLQEYHKEAAILNSLSEIPDKPIAFLYTVNGKDYTLNPDVNKMTTAQFIDFTTLSTKHPCDYSLILSTILIPKGHKYGQYDIKIVAKQLEDMCILDAMSISFFFQMALKAYTKASLDYSIRTMKRTMKKEKNPKKKSILKMTLQNLVSQKNGLGL